MQKRTSERILDSQCEEMLFISQETASGRFASEMVKDQRFYLKDMLNRKPQGLQELSSLLRDSIKALFAGKRDSFLDCNNFHRIFIEHMAWLIMIREKIVNRDGREE